VRIETIKEDQRKISVFEKGTYTLKSKKGQGRKGNNRYNHYLSMLQILKRYKII
jgi:hypothetical protein